MHRSIALSLMLAAGGAAIATVTATASAEPFKVVPAASIRFAPSPPSLPKGSQFALISGDPVKPGSFAFRLRMPAGYVIAPHTHPAAENITIISGTLYHGTGDRIDRSAGVKVSQGDFVYLPPGMAHWLYTTDAPAEIQVNGTGPFTIHYVRASDDPRDQH